VLRGARPRSAFAGHPDPQLPQSRPKGRTGAAQKRLNTFASENQLALSLCAMTLSG